MNKIKAQQGGAAAPTANETSNATTNSSTGARRLQAASLISTQNQTFWLADFDTDAFTLDQVIANLTDRGIYADFLVFYNFFFGKDGLIVQNNSLTGPPAIGGNSGQLIAQGVPVGLEGIAAEIESLILETVGKLQLEALYNITGVKGGLS